MDYRIGIGEDIHALVEGRKLVLCGVEIPFGKGLLGVSDADVVLHALSDALLGSLALGDIGVYFPPSDPKCQDLDSRLILKRCHELIKEKGYRVHNVDIAIACEKPKLRPYIDKMRGNLAKDLELGMESVSVKGMTNEGFDAVGEGRAIRALAVVLVRKTDGE